MSSTERQYDHRYHAANVGDVWKHVALIAWLSRARSLHASINFIDTHAGRGAYELGATGEWTEGLGRLRDLVAPPEGVRRYLVAASDQLEERKDGRLEGSDPDSRPRSSSPDLGPARRARAAAPLRPSALPPFQLHYPGSPRFAMSVLDRNEDRLALFELDPSAHRELSRNIQDARVTIKNSDGLEAMIDAIDEHSAVLIDPPYQDRNEWEHVPDAIARALKKAPRAELMLWYPIKSYARPNAMHLRLEKSGCAGTALELLTSPLESKKNRLNGSGVVLINADHALIAELAMLGTYLGPHLALPIPPHTAYWSTRTVGFGRAT